MNTSKRGFSDLVEVIYSAAVDGTRWPLVLSTIADSLGAVDATLEIHETAGQAPGFFQCGGRLPVDGIDAYLNHYAAVCPRIPHIFHLPRGATICDHDILDERQIDRDEFYADFLAPDGLRYFLGGILDLPIRGHAGIYVHRSPRQGHADHKALASLGRLLPHLSRVLDLYLRLGEQIGQRRSFLELLSLLPQATVALNARGEVIAANDAASRVLRDQDGLQCRNKQLKPEDRQSAKRLTTTIRTLLKSPVTITAPGQDLVLVRRPSGHPPYLLVVHRFAMGRTSLFDPADIPALLVFIQAPGATSPLSSAVLMQCFSLTPREADLAMALLKGETIQAHARTRGVRVSTVRSQLKALLRKMDLHSQMDLVRLLSPYYLADS